MPRRSNGRGFAGSAMRRHLSEPEDVQAWEDTESVFDGRALAPGSPVTPPNQKALTQVQVVFPPYIYPPKPIAQDFFILGQDTLGVGPTTAVLTDSTFRIPRNTIGVIREITVNINNLLTTSDITFRLRINQVVVPGYVLPVFPRAVASAAISFPAESTVISVPDHATIDVQVTVADAVAYQLGASYRGWHFPKALGNRFGYYG